MNKFRGAQLVSLRVGAPGNTGSWPFINCGPIIGLLSGVGAIDPVTIRKAGPAEVESVVTIV